MIHNIIGIVAVVSYLGVLSYMIAKTIKRWNNEQKRKLKLIQGDKK